MSLRSFFFLTGDRPLSGHILAIVIIVFAVGSSVSQAFVSTPKLHPIDMMHGLPRGEAPGWKSSWWASVEFNVANVWNRPMSVRHIPTQEVFEYKADYEQRYFNIDLGYQVLPSLSASLESVFVSRSGGFMDRWIDDTHQLLHMGRFKRRDYPENEIDFYARAGRNRFQAGESSGIPWVVAKLKYRLYSFRDVGDMYDGVSVSARHKVPTIDVSSGLGTSSTDTSLLAHLGYPLQYGSSLYATLSHTWLGGNPFFEGWPRYSHIWMYDLGLRLGAGEHWHILASISSQSPFMNRDDLDFVVPANELNEAGRYRADPAWYSLAEWRTQETLGVQYEPNESSEWTLYFSEDWDMGDRDIIGNWLFISGAPDVSIGLNGTFGF